MNRKKNSAKIRRVCGITRVASIRNSAGPMQRQHRLDRRAGECRNGVLRGERKASRNEVE